MPPRPLSPFVCPSCARRSVKNRRYASTSSASHSQSKLQHIDQFLTPSPTAAAASNSAAAPAPTRQNQYRIPSSALSYHWDTSPAPRSAFRAANALFTNTRPTHLWTRSTFRETPESSLPEVAFLGRSNVGKSSLLNAMLGAKELARTSGRPGRTKTMNAFLVGGDGVKNSGRGKLVVLDMPGYGKGARAEWGVEVVKYLRGRMQYVFLLLSLSSIRFHKLTIDRLKRAFLLLSAHHLTDDSSSTQLGTIRIKATDQQLLSLLRTHGIPHQIILSKIDRVLFPSSHLPAPSTFSANAKKLEHIMQGLKDVVQPVAESKKVRREGPPALGEIWGCAADGRAGVLGIDGVRVAVMRACGLEQKKIQAPDWADEGSDEDYEDGSNRWDGKER